MPPHASRPLFERSRFRTGQLTLRRSRKPLCHNHFRQYAKSWPNNCVSTGHMQVVFNSPNRSQTHPLGSQRRRVLGLIAEGLN